MSKKFLSIARLFILSMFLFLPSALHAEIFFQDDFESGNLSQWKIFENPGDPCDSTGQITATTEDKFSGIYSAKYTIPVGDMCTFMQYYPWPNPVGQGGEMYWRFRVKFASNYLMGDTNGGNENKVAELLGSRVGARIIFYLSRIQETWSIPIPANPYQMIPFIEVAANDNVYTGVRGDTWFPPNDPHGKWFSQNINTANPVYYTTGQWYTFEVYVKVNTDNNNDGVINTNDVADGAIALWVNGTKVIEFNNLYTTDEMNPAYSYHITQMGGTINQPNYIVYEDTSFYFDDVIVSDTCNSCSQSYLQFSSATYDVSEAGTTATITVMRSGSSTGAVSVDYATSNGTAAAGSDYTATSGTLSWADGDAAAKSFTITITNDTTVESSETVNITLSNPNGAQISGTNPVVLTITDNDSTGGNTGGSGGEASGGSGCGFVRDSNGKGSMAKGEGLALMIMLLIALAGIALVRRVRYLKSILFFIIFLFHFSIANAANYYVDQNNSQASDSNPGTETLPWETLKKATNTVQAGDTVIVKTGVYIDINAADNYSAFNPANSGTAGNPITFRSEPRHAAIVRAKDLPTSRDYYAWGVNSRNYIIIDGFKFEGGAIIESSSYSTIQHCDVSIGRVPSTDPSLNWGMVIGGSSYNNIVRNNYVHNILSSGNTQHNTAGIMVGFVAHYNIIENNLVDAGGGTVYSAYGQKGGNITHNIWRNNIARNATTGFLGMGSTDDTKYSDYNEYYNNIIYDTKYAFELDHNSRWFKIYNNTAYNITGEFLRGSTNNSANEVVNNIAVNVPKIISTSQVLPTTLLSYSDYNNFYGYSSMFADYKYSLFATNLSEWKTKTGLDSHSTELNPLFVDPNNNDFHLQSNSPLKGMGLGGVDIGAYATGNEVIGPTDGGSGGGGGGDTPPPSSSSGGDSSASGGSGCGFVKDDGKGQKAKGEGLTLMVMLIITLATIAIAKKAFKRKVTTGKVRRKLLNFKSRLILLALLFLFVVYTPAHATVYFYFDAEEGTVGANVPNPPFCQTQCTGLGSKATYQSSGDAPQGTQYFQWETVANQANAYTIIGNNSQTPPLVSNALGNTYYIAYFFNFTRITSLDIWHETGSSADKGIEIVGNGIRWTIGRGAWATLANNQDHRYTVFMGNPSYHLNLALEHGDIYYPNQNGYSNTNTLQLQYERWHSAVMAVKFASDNTGSVTFWIDGVKIGEYNNIKTAANSSPTISHIVMGGTIAQGAYDAPAHLRKFDALMLTDNWQDIVDGGYLSGGGNVSPTVTLSANTTSGNAPLTVNFTANASDPDGTITQYEWDLDGDGAYEAANANTTHTYTYNSAGTYNASVRVTDNGSATATNAVTITVSSSSSGGGSSSGGDSGGGSGGGGCGFVKDNSKGQGAKGEGLSMIMLFLLLILLKLKKLKIPVCQQAGM